MSRSGYTEGAEDAWELIRWRGQVASAIRGKRGQAFLRELIEALDVMPDKKLIDGELRADGRVCALGAVRARRSLSLEELDPHDYDAIADAFGIARQLVQEIEWVNDEIGYREEPPERRWRRVRDWAERNLRTA